MSRKICCRCKQNLALEAFAKKGESLQPACRKCHSDYSKSHYIKHKEYYAKKRLLQQKKVRDVVKKIKEENPCKDCNQHFPYYVMDFDHIGYKDFNVSRVKGLKATLKEISKCEVVCANCHRIRTYKRASGEI